MIPQSYSFTQEPSRVRTRNRKKYRDPFQDENRSSNRTYSLMNDSRIFRGNTYASQLLRNEQQEEQKREERRMKRRKRIKKKTSIPKMAKEEEVEDTQIDYGPNKTHLGIQTKEFKELITDKVIEKDIETQTDPFMERPETPEFMPRQEGEGKGVQVGEDLFDFDFEVEPILEVLVGKTLEQSMLEVMQEEELSNLKRQQLEFEQRRNVELAETQRLEREEQRKFMEKERRKKQERERLKKRQETKRNVASKLFAKNFLRNLEFKVVNSLEQKGFFYDVVQRQVEKDFVPWLMQSINQNMNGHKKASNVFDQLLMKLM